MALIHERGHVFLAKVFGWKVSKIEVWNVNYFCGSFRLIVTEKTTEYMEIDSGDRFTL